MVLAVDGLGLGSPAVVDPFAFDGDAELWQDYLTCGGFPRAVAEHARTGDVSVGYLRDLAAWLRRDVDPEAPAESVPALMSALAARATSPLSIASAATELGYSRRAVLDLRLRRLASTLACLWCGRREKDRPVAGAQAKLYLTDPLLAWLPSRLRAGLPTPDMTHLTETTIGVTLGRAIDNLEEGRWLNGDTIGYARTQSGNEIDLAPVNLPTPAGVCWDHRERTEPMWFWTGR